MLAPNGVRTRARSPAHGRDGETVAVGGARDLPPAPGHGEGIRLPHARGRDGTVNVVVTPKRFERQALLISRAPLLLVRGVLQVEGAPPTVVVNVRAASFHGLEMTSGAKYARGHDFH